MKKVIEGCKLLFNMQDLSFCKKDTILFYTYREKTKQKIATH